MNMMTGRLSDADIQLGEDDPTAKPVHLSALPNGPYLFGVRPNHVSMTRRSPADLRIQARVELAEINGSETSIHFEHQGASWVSRQDGVHPREVGESFDVYLEPHRIFAFDPGGSLVAAPERILTGRSA